MSKQNFDRQFEFRAKIFYCNGAAHFEPPLIDRY